MSRSLKVPSQIETVYNCIENHLKLNLRDVPISYLNEIEFLRCIKSNINLSLDVINDIEVIKEIYIEFCRRIPGLYKWRERTVYIKEREKADMSLLLSELLHAKSITQGYKQIEDWIREGLPHYLAKILCSKCDISYSKSKHQQYFSLWEKLNEKYDLYTLSTIIYARDIRLTKSILKNIMNYPNDDILEISFQKAKEIVGL
ncbi:MAG: hypothetical protein EU529_16530 [Promethearchaeota archaeon]|nr:MAG: hypothetical protein EU540_00395 [Candidatus Lokiarchaeota archaeon]TFG19289.1 MAG: hypothetical protein EU529_16530 [Candidatus Lokiarchaeota archaeon]